MEEERDTKYLILEGIIKNVLEIEEQLDSLQETIKIEGEDLDNRLKQIGLETTFRMLKLRLNTIKQYSEIVIETDQFQDELNKKYK